MHDDELSHSLTERLRRISDLERLASKVSTLRINPRECIVLRDSLLAATDVARLLAAHAELAPLAQRLRDVHGAIAHITSMLNDDVPVAIPKGGTIRAGISPELDELRDLMTSGKEKLLEIQTRERANTGIHSLKVSYNNVFGYYLEVTSAHAEKVPTDWVRKQTLTNAERYITPELKEYEAKILGAEERTLLLETDLYNGLVNRLMDHIGDMQQNAMVLAEADCLLSFATVSRDHQYVQPHFVDDQVVDIKDGRHPVIERCLPIGEEYVPNDLYLRNDLQQVLIITGPNMSGKSALLRQTALIVIMAQMGCYVPARSATLGLHDKVFSRVGASDNLATGESTFMVEMNESASILNNMTSQSLLIFDEIGRGTSTYDGISIAMSMVELLHNGSKARPNVLFATHYHELNELEARMERVRNFHVSVKEVGNKVIFLRKLVAGGTEHSFGIHVAKMAGMPAQVITRANEILAELEAQKAETSAPVGRSTNRQQTEGMQLSFFQLDDPVLEQVREEILNIDIDTLTPVEALMKLHGVKKLITGGRK
jgi:DNA mismatch repair protein MutS